MAEHADCHNQADNGRNDTEDTQPLDDFLTLFKTYGLFLLELIFFMNESAAIHSAIGDSLGTGLI